MRPGTKSLRRFLDVRGDGCRRGPRRRHLRNTRSPVGGGGGCGNDPHTRRPGLPGAGEDLPLRPAVPCPDAGDTEHLRTRLLAVRIHVSVHLPLPGRLSPPAPGRLRARRGCRQARAEGTVSRGLLKLTRSGPSAEAHTMPGSRRRSRPGGCTAAPPHCHREVACVPSACPSPLWRRCSRMA